MSKVTDLLKSALEKQKKRFFLSSQEKNFIKEVEDLLIENPSDCMLIHNVRVRLNLLVQQHNNNGKQGRMLEDLISIIILCKIEVIKDMFKSINVLVVDQLLKDKKLTEANRKLYRLYLDEYKKHSHDDASQEKISTITTQLFADENQLHIDILEPVLSSLAEDENVDMSVGKNLVNASLVCKYWHNLMNTSPKLKNKIADLRSKAAKNARINSALPISLSSYASELLNAQAAKIFVLGTHNAGATNVLRRYMQEKFMVCTPLQAGVDFRIKNIKVGDSNYRLQIWDTNDCSNKHVSTIYMRGSALSLFVFDLTSESSYNLICRRISDLKSNLSPGKDSIFPIILVGNKLDHIKGREVTDAEVSRYVDSEKLLGYFECSAKTSEGIDPLFEMVEKFIRAYIYKAEQNFDKPSDECPLFYAV